MSDVRDTVEVRIAPSPSGRYTSSLENQCSMLTLGERVLLLVHCGDHPVAGCSQCGELIHFDRLAIDVGSGRCESCPRCQLDLTDPLRKHLVECTWIRVQVHETHTRAWVLLEEARHAGTLSEQRRDRADVLGREVEAERNRSRDVKRGQNPDGGKMANALNVRPGAAELILAKVLIGQLPRRTATRTWVGVGSRLPCDGCDEPITAADLQHEVDAIGLGTLRFHKRCMQLWEEASATPRDIAGGSGAFTLTHADLLGHATGARGTHDMPTVSIAHRLYHSRNGGRPPVLRPRETRTHRGRYAAIAAAVIAIIAASALGDRPTSDGGRYGVSREHAALREGTSQTLRVERRSLAETPRSLTTKTPQPRVATSKSSRPIPALQAPLPRVLVPAVASTTSTSPTVQVLHQAP
jgi:hypothetical protein